MEGVEYGIQENNDKVKERNPEFNKWNIQNCRPGIQRRGSEFNERNPQSSERNPERKKLKYPEFLVSSLASLINTKF